MDLVNLSLNEVKKLLLDKKVTSLEVTKAVIDEIKKSDLNSVITLNEDIAYEQAKKADADIANGNIKSLTGIPIALSDNISTIGLKSTCASKIMENYVSPYDATVTTKLIEEGAVIISKTNIDEFGIGLTGETSIFGPTLNPNDKNRVAGGGCGGSAATVKANLAYGALGSDTGGSVRQPASFCGVVGFKPTYSTISRYGIIGLASSFDQAGIFAKNVQDAATLFNAVAGFDKMDGTSSKITENYEDYNLDVKGKVIGVVKQFIDNIQDEDVKAGVLNAISIFEKAGAVIKEISLDHFDSALATYYVLSSAEASSNLARFDGIKYGKSVTADNYNEIYYRSRSALMGDGVKDEIMFGNYVLSSAHYEEYFLKASKVRTLIIEDFKKAFASCDVLVGPTTPTTALALNEKDTQKVNNSEIFTSIANIAGLPAITLPCAKDNNGLPVGLQIIGNMFDDKKVLGFASFIEKEIR